MVKLEAAGKRRLGECARGLTLLALISLFQTASSIRFEVKNGSNACIIADLSINFTVEYKALKQEKITFPLPSDAKVGVQSTCGNATISPSLTIQFGANHSLSINFKKDSQRYEVVELIFVYNLSDTSLFPNATENGTKTATSNSTSIFAKTDTAYKCSNPHLIVMEAVNATFHDIKLEAYLTKNNYSENVTPCSEDILPTTAKTPTTRQPTTAAPTPTPSEIPKQGDYTFNGSSGPCILAKMGLQLNISYSKSDGKEVKSVVNIDPSGVNVNGSCSNSSATLLLVSATANLSLHFVLNSTKYYLEGVALNTILPPDAKDHVLNASNSSLTYFETATRKSFKCKSKQALEITNNFTLNTYDLQIQPFDVNGDKFGPAVECVQDENGMLVPIVVGAALAGLVLIVLIAYLIGRKRSHAGYQTI
ncbi:lysosome-associated membrane glycoprotein 1 [Pelobates fuscus]|uniref:lysosome-associated membrane glycoprotein 1 n=1 Tax=Pelobates fuscus TaxID=191477 RepID=UPI002FE49F77